MIQRKTLGRSLGAIGVAAVVAMGMVSVAVQAQDPLSSAGDSSSSAHPGDLASRVKQALHSNGTLMDKHIDVSMNKGKVVLNGFVTSPGDLQKAIRTANETAGEKNVVNNLTIKEGGDGGSG